MGETAFLRTIEVSGCYLDNILFTGASATPSDIANITTNSAGRYGFNFNNLSGVAVVHGLSGDSNTTSIVRLNGGQSGTLTILGFKTEEEISGQDPLITIDQTGQSGAQPSLFIVGGYTFGRSGVNDVIKYVNGTAGTTPYISVSNFYVQDYVNAVNDVVNSRTTAATNMNKVPFYYGPTGAFFSGQAFTLDLNTFVQSPHSGNDILTEVFGTTSSNETLVAASGTSTSISIGRHRLPHAEPHDLRPDAGALRQDDLRLSRRRAQHPAVGVHPREGQRRQQHALDRRSQLSLGRALRRRREHHDRDRRHAERHQLQRLRAAPGQWLDAGANITIAGTGSQIPLYSGDDSRRNVRGGDGQEMSTAISSQHGKRPGYHAGKLGAQPGPTAVPLPQAIRPVARLTSRY